MDPIQLTCVLCGLFLLGACVGGQLNRGIYRLAWRSRAISPWSTPLPIAPRRRWTDRIPVLGWFGLRRESALHGTGFWLRPLAVELATGIGFATLYWFEVATVGVYSGPGMGQPGWATLHAQYLAHLVLISLMLVATFIDFDEQTIPDAITVPGTLIGLALAALWPASLPLVPEFGNAPVAWVTLTVSAPEPMPGWIMGPQGLACGLLCLWAWCLAIVPWIWTTRRGWRRAVWYLVASFFRRGASYLALLIGLPATLFLIVVWSIGDIWWQSLYTSLIGMAFGGGLIWAVRLVGGQALGQESMGFGDVTLMAMIGTFVGWQATLVIFFLAPVAALFIAITQWLLTRRRDIAFGPYLCLATLYVLLRWGVLWQESLARIFSLGWYVPGMVAIGLVLMWAMLITMRFFRERFT